MHVLGLLYCRVVTTDDIEAGKLTLEVTAASANTFISSAARFNSNPATDSAEVALTARTALVDLTVTPTLQPQSAGMPT